MVISERSKEIIEYLLESNNYVTVSEVAKALGVTNRTIYRQLPEVNEVMDLYELKLENISKKGMQINGSFYQLKRLSSIFEKKSDQIYAGKDS